MSVENEEDNSSDQYVDEGNSDDDLDDSSSEEDEEERKKEEKQWNEFLMLKEQYTVISYYCSGVESTEGTIDAKLAAR